MSTEPLDPNFIGCPKCRTPGIWSTQVFWMEEAGLTLRFIPFIEYTRFSCHKCGWSGLEPMWGRNER